MNTPRFGCLLRYFLTSTRLDRTRRDIAPGVVAIKRCFSASAPVVVHETSRRVKQYGKLFVDVPWNVRILPTDPHEYPDMDRLVVKLTGTRTNDRPDDELVTIEIADDCCRITASERQQLDSDGTLLVETPIQYDVDVRTVGDSGVKVSSMVSDVINVETEKGDIVGAKLQGKGIILNSTEGGSIDLQKSLQGNIAVTTTGNGSITAEKCLGTSLIMRTENGDVTVGSNYCEQATFATANGNLNLNNLHMDSIVRISGEGFLNISCLDGSLQAEVRNGETRVQLVRLTGKSHIVSDGPVHLIVPRENDVQLNLKGQKLSLDDTLTGKLTSSGERELYETNGQVPLDIETSGSLRVTTSSWAESLQLGKFMK